MFKFSWIKIGIFVLILTSVLFAGRTAWNHYQFLLDENKTLSVNTQLLEDAVKIQQDTIDKMAADIQLGDEARAQFQQERTAAQARTRILEEKLSEHNLGFLAAERPGLVTTIINNATRDNGRCFEILSGSPLTITEINATLPSQVNSICPELANPNRRDN